MGAVKNKRMPRAVREQQMLDAAVRTFGQRGYRAASMDEIADLAGVSKPLVYLYLNSKEDLFTACIRREAAAYVVGYYPVTPNFDLFARLGYGTTALKRTFVLAPNISVNKFSAESVNYGVGGQYFLDGKNGLRVDYTRQDYNKGIRTDDTWSVGYTRRF